MAPLQTVSGIELLVITLMALLSTAILGTAVYLVYRMVQIAETDRTITADKDSFDSPGVSSADDTDRSETPALTPPVRRLIDWIVAVVLCVVGFGATVAGTTIYLLADRDRIAELVEDDVIQSDVLSEATQVEFAYTSAVWGGLGLATAGVVILLAGFALAGYRIRQDRQPADDVGSVSPMASNALLGAAVTVVASVVPFSGVLGGGVAGYLQQQGPWAGLRAGVLVGLFLAVPLFLVLGAIAVGLFTAGMVIIGLLIVGSFLLGLLFSVSMSAIGGYIGGYLVTRK